MKRSILLLILFLPFIFSDMLAQDGYMTPSQDLVDLVDGARNPSVSFSPDRETMLLQEIPSLPSIAEMAQPELRLAGIRINPNTNGPSRSGYVTGLTLRDMSTGEDREIIGLPEDPVITNVRWSPDGSHIAFLLTRTDRLELWIANVDEARAWKLVDGEVNDTYYVLP